MDIRSLYTDKELDAFLKKVHIESSQDKYGDKAVYHSYATDDDAEISILQIFETDGLVSRVSGEQGYATYVCTSVTDAFIKKGGYKRVSSIKRNERFKEAGNKVFTTVISSVIGLIIGALITYYLKLPK